MWGAALKTGALVLSLGLDTFAVSSALGGVRQTGRWRAVAAFSAAEALMPLLGVLGGDWAGRRIGAWAALAGGGALLAVAAWFLFGNGEDGGQQGRRLTGWTLFISALGVSLDELAAGFSAGLIGIPIAWTIVLIALQAALLSWIGVTWGERLRPLFGEWPEKAAGAVLGALGAWAIVQGALALAHA